jgi:membrane protease subunit HflK
MWNPSGDDHHRRPADVVFDGFQRNFRRLRPFLIFGFLALVASTGIYMVGPGEQAVIRTFGRESGRAGPGLHYHVPVVQTADVVNVEQIRRIEVGFRDKERVPSESLMLTGDENIVEAQVIVQYRVNDPSKYLYRLKDPENSLRAAAQVALRSMVGKTNIDDVITTGRESVQQETLNWLQKLMNDYQSGLSITEVKLQTVDAPDQVRDAFHDVVRAREEKEKLINQARGYEADLIPRARGEARTIEREAEAYQQERVLRAKGDAQKFDQMRAEYAKADRVTRERMYLETMERILSKIEHKVVVDEKASDGTLKLLNLTAPAAIAATGGK